MFDKLGNLTLYDTSSFIYYEVAAGGIKIEVTGIYPVVREVQRFKKCLLYRVRAWNYLTIQIRNLFPIHRISFFRFLVPVILCNLMPVKSF